MFRVWWSGVGGIVDRNSEMTSVFPELRQATVTTTIIVRDSQMARGGRSCLESLQRGA